MIINKRPPAEAGGNLSQHSLLFYNPKYMTHRLILNYPKLGFIQANILLQIK